MYAISFDLDTEELQRLYHNPSWRNGYDDIRRELEPFGFSALSARTETSERKEFAQNNLPGRTLVAKVCNFCGVRFGQQGSVYFGDESVDSVRCVLAIQAVARACPWFRQAVKDVRMLRIEENNDLLPAIDGAALPA